MYISHQVVDVFSQDLIFSQSNSEAKVINILQAGHQLIYGIFFLSVSVLSLGRCNSTGRSGLQVYHYDVCVSANHSYCDCNEFLIAMLTNMQRKNLWMEKGQLSNSRDFYLLDNLLWTVHQSKLLHLDQDLPTRQVWGEASDSSHILRRTTVFKQCSLTLCNSSHRLYCTLGYTSTPSSVTLSSNPPSPLSLWTQ